MTLSTNYPDNGSPAMQIEELLKSTEQAPSPKPTETKETKDSKETKQSSATKRRALCIGINNYPSSPLFGCVSDARRWSDWFQKAGFETELLLDEQATRQQILSSISAMVKSATAGDVVAIQYSGHGTQLPDLDGDELNGDTPDVDEALVPVDFMQGGFVIDDDLSVIADSIVEGLNVTFFFDCCHSGTATRMFTGRSRGDTKNSLPRFMPATREMIKTHRRLRSQSPGLPRGPENQREILFAACRSDQVAWESDGQGDFTRIALEILDSSGGNMTNNQFVAQVNASFGDNARQNPAVTCHERFRELTLLGIGAKSTAPQNLQSLVRDLRSLVDKLQAEVSGAT